MGTETNSVQIGSTGIGNTRIGDMGIGGAYAGSAGFACSGARSLDARNRKASDKHVKEVARGLGAGGGKTGSEHAKETVHDSYAGMRETGGKYAGSVTRGLRPWDVRHPVAAAVIMWVTWVVALCVMGALTGPVEAALYDRPAELRLLLEAKALVSVVIPAFACWLLFGRTWRMYRARAADARSSAGVLAASTARRAVQLALGILSGLVLCAAAFGVLQATGVASVDGSGPVSQLPLWVLACALNAAFQEILVRGYAFSVLRAGKGTLLATVVTTALFTLMHPDAFMCGPVAVACVAAFSVLLTVLRVCTGSLAASIGLHAAWNALGGIGFGAVVLADDYPSVLDVSLAGSTWLAGGTMGLEGSVVTLGLTCAIVVALLVLGRHAR